MPQNTPRVAVLIDGDNIPFNGNITNILKICKRHGKIVIREAFGDWQASNMSGHTEILQRLQINTIQQNRYVAGDNATDMRLAMEAVLHYARNEADVFCIVSSDSDFVPVFEKLKTMGAKVIGIGTAGQSTHALRVNCDKFYTLEKLEQLLAPKPSSPRYPNPASYPDAGYLLQLAYDQARKNANETNLSTLGGILLELAPDYKKQFGVKTLGKWIRSLNCNFEVEGNTVRLIEKPLHQRKHKPEKRPTQLNLLLEAYQLAEKQNGWVHMGKVGNVLRDIDAHYVAHFGSKKLSLWFKTYPDQFEVNKDRVRLV